MTLRWPAEAIWQAVEPLLPGFSVEVLPALDSTNSELMRRAREGRLDPILLLAERQTAGRGRVGRTWHSDDMAVGDTLTFSLGLPLALPQWSGLSLAVGLALAHALHPQVQLKWPNDLWLQGRKLGGILIETASVGDVRYAVVGVGLNLAPRSAEGLRTAPAALRELLPPVQAPDVLEQLALPLVHALLRFAQQGFAPLQSAYMARDALRGQAVLCSDGIEGVAQGVDAHGGLLVHTSHGLQTITSAEVSVRPAAAPSASTD
jgi:BirA family transcriptional regulator, biotin operon repressor / biotin---[acetyl-CoA-carboxylase] ligase